ncbi:MAG: dCMP deaminase family protein [Deltaproteobacteria bacterium]|jgi:dCMP deaminase|nr:dCMP deaminase family protein [Deltaproteobacteria bacterium]
MTPQNADCPKGGSDESGFKLPDLLTGRLISRPNWDEYFLAIAKVVSTRSTCSSRPVGCVITKDNRILVTGYNGAPPGEPHCTDRSLDGRIFCARRAAQVPDCLKLEACQSLHAEENAIKLAERLGLQDLLIGSTVYTTLSPCIRCIERLKGAGISKVFFELSYQSVDSDRDRRWQEKAESSFEVYRQISLSDPSVTKIAGALVGVTSERLLASG